MYASIAWSAAALTLSGQRGLLHTPNADPDANTLNDLMKKKTSEQRPSEYCKQPEQWARPTGRRGTFVIKPKQKHSDYRGAPHAVHCERHTSAHTHTHIHTQMKAHTRARCFPFAISVCLPSLPTRSFADRPRSITITISSVECWLVCMQHGSLCVCAARLSRSVRDTAVKPISDGSRYSAGIRPIIQSVIWGIFDQPHQNSSLTTE